MTVVELDTVMLFKMEILLVYYETIKRKRERHTVVVELEQLD